MDYRVGSFLLFVINIGEGSKNPILHNINYSTNVIIWLFMREVHLIAIILYYVKYPRNICLVNNILYLGIKQLFGLLRSV